MGELRPNQTFDRELEVLRRDRNIYEEMLRDQRSANTKRAYERNLRDFFGFLDKPVNSETVLALTAALEATGDIRKAQDLSRHADPKTLMIYDDNKNSKQAEVSEILDGLIQ